MCPARPNDYYAGIIFIQLADERLDIFGPDVQCHDIFSLLPASTFGLFGCRLGRFRKGTACLFGHALAKDFELIKHMLTILARPNYAVNEIQLLIVADISLVLPEGS